MLYIVNSDTGEILGSWHYLAAALDTAHWLNEKMGVTYWAVCSRI